MSNVNKNGALKTMVCAAFLYVCLPGAYAADFTLVTDDEYQEALSAGDNPAYDLMPKSLGGPSIEVLSPVVDDSLNSPVDIEVKFEAGGSAKIDMSTLKIYYLMFVKKDVTDRILEHAEVGEDFIKASGAKLPKGKHKFLMEISDENNKKSSRKFIVKVRG